MRASRRSVLKGAGVTVFAVGLTGRADSSQAASIMVHDSRIPESRAFAETCKGLLRINLAEKNEARLQSLRALGPNPGPVIGVTGWNDWVMVRGLLEEKGLRLVSEAPVPAPVSGKAHLFAWEMR